MGITPEQVRKALVDIFRDPETRLLIFPPGPEVQGGNPSTVGRIAKFIDTSDNVGDTVTPMFEDATNSRIGIGTSTPDGLLHLKGTVPTLLGQDGTAADRTNLQTILGSLYVFANAKFASGQYTCFNTSNPAWLAVLGNGSGAGDTFAILRAAASAGNLTFSEFLRISNAGKVGIGTASPGEKLEVNGVVYTNAESGGLVVDAGGYKRVGFMKYSGSEGTLVHASGVPLRVGRTSAADVTQVSSGNFTLEMWIDNAGNVGIGTSGPANKLDVVGDIGIKSGGSLKLYNSGNTASVELSYTTIAASPQTAVASENPLVANVATMARPDMATVNIGDGAWNGGAGAFSGSAAGTLLGANAVSGFTGALMDLQRAGVSRLFVAANGKVGIGTTSDLSTLTVKANASFDAAGTVEIVAGSINVNGTSTTFKSQVSVGDKIRVTTGGTTYTRTVISVPSDMLLTVDTAFPVPASGLTMKVLPSIAKLLGADGTIKFIIDDSGFLGLAGTTVNDNEKVGYVICNADVLFSDPAGAPSNNNQEMRGYQATMRYTRNSPDGNVIYSQVTTSGSSVQRTGGRLFVTGGAWNGLRIDIADKSFVIASVTDASNLTLTTTPTPAYSSAVLSAVVPDESDCRLSRGGMGCDPSRGCHQP